MKAVRCRHGQVHVDTVERPQQDGVRVKVVSAGICGSDLHLLNAGFDLPGTLGHEVAGIAENGQAVAIEPIANCGHCPYCLRGEINHCLRGAGSIMGIGIDGGMAEEMVVPASALVPLASNVSAKDACLVEPLSVAVHGIGLCELQPGMRVAIIGAGTIGLCALAVLNDLLPGSYVAARHDHQRSVVEQLGGTLSEEGDYDLVIDCAGSSESLAQCARLCRPKGQLLLLATYWSEVAMPAMDICMKELTVRAASMHGRQGPARDIDVAATTLARMPQLPELLITHRMPLTSAAEAFATAARRDAGAIKVCLHP